MFKATPKVTWSHKGRPLNKASLAKNVAENVKADNGDFPSPTFSINDMMAASQDLVTKYANRLNGPVAKTEFEQAEHAVEILLYAAASYVSGVADGNVLIIEKAGFIATTNVHTPSQVPGQPLLKVESDPGAKLFLSSSDVAGAHTTLYIVAWGTDLPQISITDTHVQVSGGANMIIIPDGHLHELVTGIPAGTHVYCWCLAQNTAGKSPLSSMVDAYIQK